MTGRHRAGRRLGALALLALAVSLMPDGMGAVLAVIAAGGALLRASRRRAPLHSARPLLFVAVFVLVTVGLFSGPEAAVIATARIVGLLLVAAVVTATISHTEMMEVVTALARPLGRFGVRPERVALVLSLTITTAPVLLRHAKTIREAQRARGLRAGPRFVLPLLIVALRHADTMADSLTSRGL